MAQSPGCSTTTKVGPSQRTYWLSYKSPPWFHLRKMRTVHSTCPYHFVHYVQHWLLLLPLYRLLLSSSCTAGAVTLGWPGQQWSLATLVQVRARDAPGCLPVALQIAGCGCRDVAGCIADSRADWESGPEGVRPHGACSCAVCRWIPRSSSVGSHCCDSWLLTAPSCTSGGRSFNIKVQPQL